jgi:dodecin
MSNVNGNRRMHEDRYEPRQQSFEPRDDSWQRREERVSRRNDFPIVKVIEVLAQSPHSWEDAARRAVGEASKTIRDIRSVYIEDMQAVVDDDQIVAFRINAKVSFVLDGNRRGR